MAKYINPDEYKDGKHKEPNRYAVKDEQFYLKMAWYIWSQYRGGFTSVGYEGYSATTGVNFDVLRAYGLGQQDKFKYLELLDDCDPLTKEGYMNLNIDIVQILPKFRDIVKGKIMGIDFEVNTQAMDEVSSKARLKKANKMRLLTNPTVQAFMERTGVAPADVDLPEYIKSAEDVDVYIKMGGVRLDYEMAMRDAIECTKYESRWDTLKDKIVEDIVDLGICAVKTKVHTKTHKVIGDYVDPKYLVVQRSRYADHRDSTWAGVIREVTIAELRMESSLTERQLMDIAKKYRGNNGNAVNNNTFVEVPGLEYEKSYRGNYNFDYTTIGYNDFSVHIMEYYFLAKDVERYIVGVREKEGNDIYDRVDRNARLSSKDKAAGKSFDDKIIEKCYGCNWIIGTEYLYDCGEEYGIAKASENGVKQALLPIQVYSNKSKSIVERCIRFVDDIQLATLKKANTLSKMAPGPRMIIDKSIVRDSVTIGEKVYSMLDLVGLYVKSGVFIMESIGEYEGDEGGSNRKPFEFAPSGVQEDINIFLQEIGHNIDQIRQVTGVNEVADGSTQKGDMLVKVMEGLNAATNNALKPHFRLYEGLFTNWCKYTVLKWQAALIGGDININFIPFGDSSIKTISLSSGLYEYDYGIHITLAPSNEDRQMLLAKLEGMQQENQIPIEDYFVLFNMIRNGDIKKAQLFLAKSVKAHRKLMHQMELEKLKAQGEANGQAAAMAEQERAKTMQVKAAVEKELIVAQGEEDRKTIAFQAQFNMKAQEDKDVRKLQSDASLKIVDKQLENNNAPQPQTNI